MADVEETTVGGHDSWWRKHGLAVSLLVAAASISFLIRVLFAYQLIQTCDISYCYAGGSDSFYHSRVMEWIIGSHSDLTHDPMLNYPTGAVNPREPLFDWMNAILGILLAPFFGGDAVRAGMWVLEMQPPFWAAVGVFPVYLIGKEVSSRRMGLLAALLYPLVVGNIQSTVATYANYLPFYTFFVLLTAWAYIHTIRLSGTRRWVESYRSPRAIWAGVKQFCRVEENAVRWSVFTGISLGATMFAWQGYTYVITIIMVFLVVTVLVERVRRHDTFGAYLATLLAGTLGFLMAMPYYAVQGEFGYWFTVPLLLFFGGLLVLLPFLLMRDAPWVVSIPALVGSVAAGAGALYLYNSSYFDAVITGQGYFVKNLIFSTVAEAQAPSFDALIVSYGIATFLLTFVGLAIFVAYLFIYRFRREHIFMVVLGLLGIYLPISAAKFFLLGSPIFVLLPAEILLIGLDRVGGYSQLRRNLSSLSDRGGRFMALRRSFKLRHLFLGILVILVVLPNVTWAVDSGIPYNVQSQYSQQIYASLPTVLQTAPSNASSFYLGIAGIQTDTPQQYDESGYNWLSTQDTFEQPQDRPAFVSWWDYGFQAIDQGQHPSVADNFQNGIDPAGNFLLAQNESLAISYMTSDLLVALAEHPGLAPYCSFGDLMGTLHQDGLNTSTLYNYLYNSSADVHLVASNPGFYGPKDNGNLDPTNSMYDTVSYLIASSLSENGVVQVYQDVQTCTHWSIRYAMADTRLFPTSGSNTGIYYAPVDLTDGVIGSGGIPTYYFTVTVTGTDGNTYALGQVPAGVGTASTQINYNPAFYNSMIYKIEAGYNGSEIGSGNGVPGLTLSGNNPEPGWMMQHFVMGYRTAYYCPYTDYQSHPNCFSAVNMNVAQAHQAANQGTSDLSPSTYFSSGGETILEYYAGARVQGTITLSDGTPVPGVRVTVDDSWGYPHMTTTTNKYGGFDLIAPPGNDSFIASYGAVTPLTMVGSTQVAQYNLTVRSDQGFGADLTPITPHITLKSGAISGTVYWNKANQSTYQSNDIVIPGAQVTVNNGLGTSRTVSTDASGTYSISNLVPGAYNVSLTVGSHTESQTAVNLLAGIAQNPIGLHMTEIHGVVRNQTGRSVQTAVVTLVGPNGFSGSTSTLQAGNYSFTPLVPGNYTVEATDNTGQSSVPAHVDVPAFASNVTVNLTLTTPVEVSLLPLLNGNALPNIPVRFTAVGGGANGTFLYLTGTDGWIHAVVGMGNWSVYALGVVNGTYVAGIGDLSLTPTNAESFSGGSVLPLSEAEPLTGYVYSSIGTGGPQSGVKLTLQDERGATLTTVTNSSGGYSLWLPRGTYAVTANSSSAGQTGAAFAGTTVAGPTVLDLSLSAAVPYHAEVGFTTPEGSFQALPGATVNLTLDSSAATVELTAGSSGNLSLSLPTTSSTFSLSSHLFGFTPFARSSLSESTLTTAYSRIALNISQVPVHVLVFNSTAGSTPQVNFTGLSTATQSVNTTGTNVTLQLYPGTYSVSAWAPFVGGGVDRPFTNLTLYVPIGSSGVFLNFTLSSTVGYKLQNLSVFPHANQAYARLTGPLGTIALNGSALLHGFSAPPGTYNLWVTAHNGSQPYAYFDPIKLNATGSTWPSNVTLVPAGTLDFSMRAPWGQVINASLTVTISNGNGTQASFTTGPQGNATLLLPRGGYNFSMNAPVLLDVNGVTEYWTVSTNSSHDVCAVAATGTSSCALQVDVTRAMDTVQPSLLVNGGEVVGGSGTIYALSSAGGTPAVFPIYGGTASLSLLPGRYTLYTVLGGTSAPEVNITTVVLPYANTTVALPLNLAPGWVQNLGITLPSGLPGTRSVALVFHHVDGPNMTVGNVSVGDYPLVLPAGAFVVTASASVAPYGPTIPLLGEANLTIDSSNAYVPLPLLPQWSRATSMTLVGGGPYMTNNGGSVSYQIVVNNTGNAPLPLRVTGSPSGWSIRSVPGNFTLGTAPNNNSQVLEVTVTVPNSQVSTLQPLNVQVVDQSGGTARGSITLPISLVPTFGFEMGSTVSFDAVQGGAVVLGFHVGATGNSPESVTLSVANGAQLSQDGWAYLIAVASTTAPVTGPETLTPGSAPFQGQVELFPRTPAPIFPAYVMVAGVDAERPALTGLAYLPFVGHAVIGLNATARVTGPNVGGTPPPDYQTWLFPLLTALPAIAIVSFAGSWRWWRTRRWVRR